jgi:hypothetical protein
MLPTLHNLDYFAVVKFLPTRPAHRIRGMPPWTLGVLLGLILGTGRLVAQVTSGTNLGSVQDPSGAAIPGATVTATAPAVGITRTVAGKLLLIAFGQASAIAPAERGLFAPGRSKGRSSAEIRRNLRTTCRDLTS